MQVAPIGSSRLRLVQHALGDLTVKQLQRGVFRSVLELIAAIDTHMAQRHAQPNFWGWTKTVHEILTKVNCPEIVPDKTRTV